MLLITNYIIKIFLYLFVYTYYKYRKYKTYNDNSIRKEKIRRLV